MSKLEKILLVALVIEIIAIAGMIYFFVYIKKPTVTSHITNSTPVKDEAKLYVNQSLGFSAVYPNSKLWSASDNDDERNIPASIQKDESHEPGQDLYAIVTIIQIEMYQNKMISDLAQDKKFNGLTQGNPEPFALGSNLSAVSYRENDLGQDSNRQVIFYQSGQKAYQILIVSIGYWQRDKDEVIQILNSFKLIN